MNTDYPKSNSPRVAALPVAAVARVLARQNNCADIDWRFWIEEAEELCEAHTRALGAAGIVLAPLEPTEAMLSAYSGALKAHIEAVPEADRKWRKRRTFAGGPAGYKIPPDEKARCRYRAMIAARTEEPR